MSNTLPEIKVVIFEGNPNQIEYSECPELQLVITEYPFKDDTEEDTILSIEGKGELNKDSKGEWK